MNFLFRRLKINNIDDHKYLLSNMNIVENMRLPSIDAKIRNFKNEKILNF